MNKNNSFSIMFFLMGTPLILLLILPVSNMFMSSPPALLLETIKDKEVLEAIFRSVSTSLAAAVISFLFGTPLAYLLARKKFLGKQVIEGLIDLPMMIPHPVIGIAILSISGRDHPIGKMLAHMGVQIMGSITGIIVVLTFVGLPFYINTVKAGFEAVPTRLENASRTLGAGMFATFMRVTFPLTWKSMMLGMVMCTARAISEFGAIVVVAYHPMTAPVLIYERFTAYGLKYSQPVAVWLIMISLVLFVCMRFFSQTSTIENR